MKALKVAELFAGVGGFRLGLESVKDDAFTTVWSNQWEPSTKRQHASEVYALRFGEAGHCNQDISTVPTNEIPDHDMLVGGFPCQDYSVASTLNRSGGIVGKKGVLWWQIHRILQEKQTQSPKAFPKYLFLENVDRLLKSPATQRGRDFAIMLASLDQLGYAVEWRVVNAADYGMPQRRRRIFIVGYHKSTALYKQLKTDSTWATEKGVFAHAFEAIADGSEHSFKLDSDLKKVSDDFNKERPGTSPFENAGSMKNGTVHTIKTKPNWEGKATVLGDILLDEKDVPKEFFIDDADADRWTYLKGAKKEQRLNKASGKTYNYAEGGMVFPDPLDKPSRTIITGEGGKSPSRFKHVVRTPSGKLRRLTPLELERLNMFPDHHTEGATDAKRAFFMGNALVVGVINAVGSELARRILA